MTYFNFLTYFNWILYTFPRTSRIVEAEYGVVPHEQVRIGQRTRTTIRIRKYKFIKTWMKLEILS